MLSIYTETIVCLRRGNNHFYLYQKTIACDVGRYVLNFSPMQDAAITRYSSRKKEESALIA